MRKYIENIRIELKKQGFTATSEQIRQAINIVCPHGQDILREKSKIVTEVLKMVINGNRSEVTSLVHGEGANLGQHHIDYSNTESVLLAGVKELSADLSKEDITEVIQLAHLLSSNLQSSTDIISSLITAYLYRRHTVLNEALMQQEREHALQNNEILKWVKKQEACLQRVEHKQDDVSELCMGLERTVINLKTASDEIKQTVNESKETKNVEAPNMSTLTCFDILSNFNPRNLDIRSLPSVQLKERVLLPDISGVYFVYSVDILYIGKTHNLRKRWISHHRTQQLEALGDVTISYLAVPRILLSYIEDVSIEYFRPLLNNTEIDKLEEAKFEINQNLQELINPLYIAQVRNNYPSFQGNDVEFIQWLLTSIAVGAINIQPTSTVY